jgi:sodium/hydrogen antiporter
LVLSAFVLSFSLISQRISKTPITGPIIFVAFGALVGPFGLGVLELDVGNETVRLLAETTLALVLFTDSSRIDLRSLRTNSRFPVRLLLIGLPLTIVTGAMVAWVLFRQVTLWDVLLLSAILAPTDAALGQVVVTDKRIPSGIRQALNIESGLNDGICVPIVTLFIAGAAAAAAGEGLASVSYWVVFAVKSVGLGIVSGLSVGAIAAFSLVFALARGWMSHHFMRLSMLSTPLFAFSLAEGLGGSGFIAAFVGGLVVGNLTSTLGCELFEFVEESSNLLGLVTWVAFGVIFVGPAVESVTLPAIIFALLSLTVVRMVPVAISLLGMALRWESVAFLGWFGPRGLASVVFAIVLHEHTQLLHHEHFFFVVTWTIVFSVLMHGASAVPAITWYGRRCDPAIRECTVSEAEAFGGHTLREHYLSRRREK